MKPKVYTSDFVVNDEERRPIIVITHGKYTFSANDDVRKSWTYEGDMFLQPKGRG